MWVLKRSTKLGQLSLLTFNDQPVGYIQELKVSIKVDEPCSTLELKIMTPHLKIIDVDDVPMPHNSKYEGDATLPKLDEIKEAQDLLSRAEAEVKSNK